jgi:hypothetical protein
LKTSAEKSSTTTSKPAPEVQANGKPFFSRGGSGDFFPPAVQAKLHIGKAGDHFEREADSMAEMVVNGAESAQMAQRGEAAGKSQRQPLAEIVTPFVQRQAEEEEEPVQMAEEEEAQQAQSLQRQGEEEEEPVQMAEEEEAVQARFNSVARRDTPSLESRLRSGAGQGRVLSDGIRAEMEQGFGADFGNVRIHTGALAVGMNEDLHAQAFAHGSDIYFNTGKYNPATPAGKMLLAHELTHTIQQGATHPLESAEQAQQPNEGTAANPAGSASPVAIPPTDLAPLSLAEEADTFANAMLDTVPEADLQDQETMLVEAPEPEETDFTPRSPEEDPNFQAVAQNAEAVAGHQQRHNPPEAEAASAQAAAPVADNEMMGAAQANQVEAMNEQEPGEFDAEGFKTRLMERIESMQLPANQEQAANFDENNNIGEINQAANQDVSAVQQNAAAPIDTVSQAEPDTGAVAEREVTPLPSPDIGTTPGSIAADSAMPPPRPESEVSQPLQENLAQVDNAMAENEVTDEMLANSNEPAFVGALEQTNQARDNTASAPDQLRPEEGTTLSSAQQGAEQQSNQQLHNMQNDRVATLGLMAGQQNETASQDSTERQRISAEIDAIYNRTQTDVEQILENLETQVSEKFTAAANRAKDAFENYVDLKMSAYKSRRYSGLIGAGRWVKDKFLGLPDEVNQFFVDGRELYINQMDRELTTIAQFVAEQLTAAKNRIAEGRQEVADYVAALPESLQSIGREAAEAIQSQFDSLQDDVNSKQDELIDSLAQQYTEALQEVDARIEEMKAANRGLVDMALDAINGVIETIKKLRQLIADLLSAIQSLIGVIMADPIDFMRTLFAGIKQGIENFKANVEKHLVAGLFTWLTGALGPMGIQVPDNLFSLPGIFNLIMQVLGLGWDFIRRKMLMVLPEPAVRAIETSMEVFKIIRERGLDGLWEFVKDKFTDLKETVIDAIQNMLITQVIQAGIKWLLSLLIPGAGFIKAIMAIKDVIVFFVESAIMLIPALIEGIRAAAAKNFGGIAKAIEDGIARLIPLIIGLLARLIGISGLAKKVQVIITKIRKRIDKEVTKLITKAKNWVKKMWGRGKKGAQKVKDKLLDWWKVKKQFKGKDGKNHALYYQGNGEQAVLMMASNPQGLIEKIDERLAKETDPASIEALIQAKQLKKDLDSYIKIEERTMKADPNKSTNAFKKEIDDRLTVISVLLQKVNFEDADLPLSNITYSMSDGRATEVKAYPLTKMPGNTRGSVPRENPLGWNQVQAMQPAEQKRWVRLHLVNHHLHGPGKKWNLTPGTKEVNAQMEKDVESKAKDAIEIGKIIFYEVRVNYHSESGAENFPREVGVTWGELKKEGNGFQKLSAPYKPFYQPVPGLALNQKAILNESSAAKLIEAVPEVPAEIWRQIIEVRRNAIRYRQKAKDLNLNPANIDVPYFFNSIDLSKLLSAYATENGKPADYYRTHFQEISKAVSNGKIDFLLRK